MKFPIVVYVFVAIQLIFVAYIDIIFSIGLLIRGDHALRAQHNGRR